MARGKLETDANVFACMAPAPGALSGLGGPHRRSPLISLVAGETGDFEENRRSQHNSFHRPPKTLDIPLMPALDCHECERGLRQQTFGAVQELFGREDVATTMICTHVLNKGGHGVKSPVDVL